MKKMMNKTTLMVITVFLCITVNIFPQSGFEGKITVKVPELGNSGELSYYIKGDKIRINVEGKQRNSDLIIDPVKNEKILLLTQMNKYVVFPLNNGKNEIAKDSGGKNEVLRDFKNTGIKKNISGRVCEKWVYYYSDREIIAWLTRGLGSFKFFKDPMENGIEPAWKNEVENSGYFPMKIEDKIMSGGSMTIMEVREIKRMNIGNDYFRPPKDFEKMKKPDMNSMKNFMQKGH